MKKAVRVNGREEWWTYEEWQFCPFCGSKGVWSDSGNDYYYGETLLCPSCGAVFSVVSWADRPEVFGRLRKENVS